MGCAREAPLTGAIVVTLDTTRADAFGQYGNPDGRTPAFDAWARSGALVRWAIADAPLTLPSHTTLWTGVPAVGHGVRTNVNARVGPAAETLAEVLAARGYRTGAIVSTQVLRRETGIDQGFADFDDPESAPGHARRADEAVDRALRWLREPAREPVFLWLHLFDAHSVWEAPAPWGHVLSDPYAAEIAFVDSQLARLRRECEGRDTGRGLTVLVVADHGEGLEDHREEEHGIFLYDEIVRVPLFVASPELPGGRVLSAQVRTMDVAPTVLDLLGLPPDLGLGGTLVPALTGLGPVPDPVAYSESMRPRVSHSGAPLKTLRTQDLKFVWSARPEWYDLTQDPAELVDRASASSAVETDGQRERLERIVRSIREHSEWVAEPLQPEQETLRTLRSLGYVGGGESTPARGTLADEMDVSGFDAKDFVDVAMGGRDLEMGRFAAAERKLRRFLGTTPPLATRPELRPLWAAAHQNLGSVAMRQARPDTAAVHFQSALRLDADNAVAQEGLIAALNCAGRPEAAVLEADALLRRGADLWRVRLHRALALALSGRSDEGGAALAEIEQRCPREDVREVAAFFRSRLGTDQEAETLRVYLASQ